MITSVKNEKVKKWKKLHKKKERLKTQTFLIEGFHLLEEAWKSNWDILEIIVQENIQIPNWCKAFDIEMVTENVFQHISETQTPQGIAAVVKIKEHKINEGDFYLLIDAIQDPGNLGTIIRTADACGIDGIILGNGTVDLYNDKVIRATQGSIFHVPIVQSDLQDVILQLKEKGFSIWATALKSAKKYNEIFINQKVALILGNEGSGVDESFIHLADEVVKIPIYGKAESLNVSIAAGILMYYIKG